MRTTKRTQKGAARGFQFQVYREVERSQGDEGRKWLKEAGEILPDGR
jgi:hypothetical protein